MTGRRLAATAAALVLGVAMIVVTIVIARAEDPPSAATALVEARRFVTAASSVEYTGTVRTEYADDDEWSGDAPLSEEPLTGGGFVGEGAEFEEQAVFPDRSRSVVGSPWWLTEAIEIDGVVYTRTDEGGADLADELWTRVDPYEEEEPGLFSFSAPAFAFPTMVAPLALPDLVGDARAPRIVHQRGGRTVIRVDLAPSRYEPFLFLDLFDEVGVWLVVADDGRLDELWVRGADDFSVQTTRLRFERWNGDVVIAEPPAADIDPTPHLDEEGVAEFGADTPVWWPRAIPEGWSLDSAAVFSFAGAEECTQVMLEFSGDDAFGFLSLSVRAEGCEDEFGGGDDFTAGPYEGWIVDEDGYVYGELTVSDVVIAFDTDLAPDDVAVVLGDLVPVDFAEPPAAALPIACTCGPQ